MNIDRNRWKLNNIWSNPLARSDFPLFFALNAAIGFHSVNYYLETKSQKQGDRMKTN